VRAFAAQTNGLPYLKPPTHSPALLQDLCADDQSDVLQTLL
jgi:hypothetical protein